MSKQLQDAARDAVAATMARHNLSDEQWDALPESVRAALAAEQQQPSRWLDYCPSCGEPAQFSLLADGEKQVECRCFGDDVEIRDLYIRNNKRLCQALGMNEVDFDEALNVIDGRHSEQAELVEALRNVTKWVGAYPLVSLDRMSAEMAVEQARAILAKYEGVKS
jgi:hypothetical protein